MRQSLPKVYLYSGQYPKAYIIDEGSSWSILLERTLLEKLTQNETKELVTFLSQEKNCGAFYFQTKAFGTISFLLGSFMSVMNALVIFTPMGKKVTYSLRVTGLIFLKPAVELIFFTSKFAQKKVDLNIELIKSFLRNDGNVFNYNEFVLANIENSVHREKLLKRFLETFPMYWTKKPKASN